MKKQILRLSLIPVRLARTRRYPVSVISNWFKWLYTSREHTNLTYNLEPLNVQYMAAMIAEVTGRSNQEILKYISDLENDHELRLHITGLSVNGERSYLADKEARYARRAGWYAIVRALKPRVVVETGIDKGLGACVIAAALKKNSEEGTEGRYYGTDINPKAGYFFTDPYSKYGEILYGDSIESLEKLDENIDLLINDSDHSAEYEMREYESVKNKLNPGAIIVGDNAHCSESLYVFSTINSRRFLYFQEKPVEHWYPGGGMGLSF